MSPVIVSASQFRNKLFALYQDHLASDAKNPRPVRVMNLKTNSLMFDIAPLKSKEDKERKRLRIFLEKMKRGEYRYPEYDYEAYKKMKARQRARSKKLIRGEYE